MVAVVYPDSPPSSIFRSLTGIISDIHAVIPGSCVNKRFEKLKRGAAACGISVKAAAPHKRVDLEREINTIF